MNLLLDTHIALWAITDHPRLSQAARKLILDPDNAIYYSVVSVWEVLLKNDSAKNNLSLSPEDFVQFCEEAGFFPLTLKPKHIVTASKLDTAAIDKRHSDPFDRILLAQAKTENYSFITHDEKLPLYNEKCIISV